MMVCNLGKNTTQLLFGSRPQLPWWLCQLCLKSANLHIIQRKSHQDDAPTFSFFFLLFFFAITTWRGMLLSHMFFLVSASCYLMFVWLLRFQSYLRVIINVEEQQRMKNISGSRNLLLCSKTYHSIQVAEAISMP